MSDKLSVTYLQCIMVISKIKYEFFYLDLLLFQTEKLLLFGWRDAKEKHKNIELISRFKYA